MKSVFPASNGDFLHLTHIHTYTQHTQTYTYLHVDTSFMYKKAKGQERNQTPQLEWWFSQVIDTVTPVINGKNKKKDFCWQSVEDGDYFLRKKRLDVIFPPVLTPMKEHLEKQDA